MKIFLDSNVLIDVIAQRLPDLSFSEKIIELAANGKFEAYCSSLSVSHIFYSCRKIIPPKQLKEILKDLTAIVMIAPVDKTIIEKSFSSSFVDFEDAIQHECALSIKGVNYIITGNRKDFKYSAIKTLNPAEFIKTYNKEN